MAARAGPNPPDLGGGGGGAGAGRRARAPAAPAVRSPQPPGSPRAAARPRSAACARPHVGRARRRGFCCFHPSILLGTHCTMCYRGLPPVLKQHNGHLFQNANPSQGNFPPGGGWWGGGGRGGRGRIIIPAHALKYGSAAMCFYCNIFLFYEKSLQSQLATVCFYRQESPLPSGFPRQLGV